MIAGGPWGQGAPSPNWKSQNKPIMGNMGFKGMMDLFRNLKGGNMGQLGGLGGLNMMMRGPQMGNMGQMGQMGNMGQMGSMTNPNQAITEPGWGGMAKSQVMPQPRAMQPSRPLF